MKLKKTFNGTFERWKSMYQGVRIQFFQSRISNKMYSRPLMDALSPLEGPIERFFQFHLKSAQWNMKCILCQNELRNLWTAIKLQPCFALEHVYRHLQEKRRGLINEQEAGAIAKVTVKLWSFDQSRASRKRVVKHTTTIIPYLALC